MNNNTEFSISWSAFTSLLKRPIAFHRVFAQISGSATTGLFLSQLWYWSEHTSNTDGWFYKTAIEWQEETALTRREQETARKKLRLLGILEEKKECLPRKLFFRLNRERLVLAVQQLVNDEPNDLSVEQILEIFDTSLNGLSRGAFLRAEKLKVKREFVDYREVLRSRGLTCRICGEPITKGLGQNGEHLVFDHWIALNNGGSHTYDNIFPAHAFCNSAKSDKCLETLDTVSLLSDDKQACHFGASSSLNHDEQERLSTTSKNVMVQQTGTFKHDKQSIYTENTSETTNRDYNREESPLTPHRGNAAIAPNPAAKFENAADQDQEKEPKDSTQQIVTSCTDLPEYWRLTRNPELGKSSAAQLEVIPSSGKAKNSRRGKSALDEQTQAWFLEAYLSNKPSNFTDHRKLSPQVGKKIQELIASHQGQAIEVFASALVWVREQKDDWWRKTAQFSLDNLCTNGKIEQYADKHAFAMQHDAAYRDRVEGRAPSMDAARRQQDTFTDNNGNTIPADSLVARAAAAWANDPFLQMICPDFKL